MENRRALIAACITAIFGVPLLSFAYSVPTHEGITQVVLQQYEKLHGEVFTSEQETAMIRGSNEEDDDFRYKYHFYDPVNNIGLWGRLESSKEWVNNQDLQGGSLNSWQGYFDRPEDYTWDRAIYEYVHGDKKRAAESLGHVLHLIEDSSVPAHVRNDAHGNLWGIGDPDTYEKYTGIFTNGNVNIVGRIIPKTFRTLAEAFDAAARFTNENFVSDDTAFAEYIFPKKSDLIVRNGYGYHPKSGHRVASAKQVYDKTIGTTSTEFKFEKSDPSVVNDYWNMLSRHAVESGIGVIDLFFREVEKERLTGALKEKNLSPLKRHNKKLASGFSLVKALYGSSLNQSDVNELLSDSGGQAGAAALAVVSDPEPVKAEVPMPEPVVQEPALIQLLERKDSQETAVPETSTQEPVAQTVQTPVPTEPSPYQNLFPVEPGFGQGGGGGSGSSSQSSTEAPTETPLTITISSPASGALFATTSVTFSGSTEANTSITLTDGTSTATTTANGTGAWSAGMTLSEGSPTITVSGTNGTRSATSTISVTIDTTAPSAPTITLSQCSNSLSSSFCLLATRNISVIWADVTDAAYYAVSTNGTLGATTTATSSTVMVSFSASSTIAVVAYDSAGNAATSTETSIYAIEHPLIINEIAWAGTDTTASDEWIELKNLTTYAIDMSKVTLDIGGSIFALSGTLDATSLYLVEDRSEATSKTHNATLDMDLSDSGARIRILDSGGTAMDSTPEVATCLGWCGGALSTSIGTSAQFGDLTAKKSMERMSPIADGALAASWQSNDTYIRVSGTKATDSSSGTILGTPGMQSSSGLPTAGWNCGGATLTTSGGSYNPTSSACTYLSAFISTQANRYGDVYRGTVGSSTLVSGHSLSKAIQSDQNDSGIVSGAASGDEYFVALMEIRNFGSDLTDFRNYFKTGVGTTPHSNYVTIPWTYSP